MHSWDFKDMVKQILMSEVYIGLEYWSESFLPVRKLLRKKEKRNPVGPTKRQFRFLHQTILTL